jgi:hypothetical protein
METGSLGGLESSESRGGLGGRSADRRFAVRDIGWRGRVRLFLGAADDGSGALGGTSFRWGRTAGEDERQRRPE